MLTKIGSKLRSVFLAGVSIVSAAPGQAPAPESKPTPIDYRDDPAVWGYGSIGGSFDGSSKRVMPPPIVPTAWLVVPRASKADEEQLLTRFALDPDAPLPAATKRASGNAQPGASTKDAAPVEWLAVESREPQDALIAFTTITSESDDVRMAQLTGAELLFVNGEGFAGDVERLGFRGVPVLLKKGANRVFVAGIRGSFTLELWKPATRMVIGTWDVAWPGYGALESDEVTYPLFNASIDPADCIHVHYGHGMPEGGDCRVRLTDWRDGGYLAPLGLMYGTHYWSEWIEPCTPPEQCSFEVGLLCVYNGHDPDADRQVLRRALRDPKEPADGVAPRSEPNPARRWKPTKPFEPYVLVYGTKGSPEETAALLAQARFDQELSWARTRGVPLMIPDHVYLDCLRERGNGRVEQYALENRVVLYGNADTNGAWPEVVHPEFGLKADRGRLRIGENEQTGDDLFGWFLCAVNEPGRATANAVVLSTGVPGARAGALLHPFSFGLASIDDALYRRDSSAPQGRRALDFPRR